MDDNLLTNIANAQELGDQAAISGVPVASAGGSAEIDSEILRDILEKEDLRTAIAFIKREKNLTKVSPKWWGTIQRHGVVAYVDMESLKVCWSRNLRSPLKGKKKKYRKISLLDVTAIVPGVESKGFKRVSRKDRPLGFVLETRVKSYRFIVDTVVDWRLWLRGLLYAQNKAVVKRKRIGMLKDPVLRDLWVAADSDQSDSMQLGECLAFLRKIGVHADVCHVTQLFDTLCEDQSNVLEFDEFQKFMMILLAQRDLTVIFSKYQSDSSSPVLTEANFISFLSEVQRAKPEEIEDALNCIRNMTEPFRITKVTAPHEQRGGLTLYGFCYYIMSESNSILNSVKAEMNQAMNLPITDYWIRTIVHPLDGPNLNYSEKRCQKAQLGRLKHALVVGYRCFLFDCVEINSKIFLRTLGKNPVPIFLVLKSIKSNAFKANSAPVFLIFDVGDCQPSLLNENIERILGNLLYKKKEGDSIPSPSSLSNRFVIMEMSCIKESVLSRLSKRVRKEQKLLDKLFWGLPCDLLGSDAEFSSDVYSDEANEKETGSDTDAKETGPSTEDLAMRRHVIYTDALEQIAKIAQAGTTTPSSIKLDCCNYRGNILNKRQLSNPLNESTNSLFLVDRSDMNNFTSDKKASEKLSELSKRNICLATSYDGVLVTTSLDPLQSWTRGIQFVPIPGPSKGLGKLLDSTLFLQNNRCGFVLKPKLLLQGPNTSNLKEPHIDIVVSLICARQLPHVTSPILFSQDRSDDRVSPFITVSLLDPELQRTHYTTPVVLKNGLDPRWEGQKFIFEMNNSSLSFLVFEVRNFDTNRISTIAWAAIPLACARQGLRWVPLVDRTLEKLIWSGMLIEISFRPSRKKTEI